MCIIFKKDCSLQRGAKWGSRPLMGVFKRTTFASKRHQLIRLTTDGQVKDDPKTTVLPKTKHMSEPNCGSLVATNPYSARVSFHFGPGLP